MGPHQEMFDEDGNDDCGSLGLRTVACGFGHWSDHWEELFEGHSWTTGVVLLVTVEVGLLSCVCAVFDRHLPTGNVYVTREPEVAWQPSGMT